MFWDEMSYRYQLGLTGLLYLLKFVSLLIFCLVDLSIGVSGVLKSPTATAVAAKSLQSCPTLCDPIDGSPPGSSVHGICQAGVLEWLAIAFSRDRHWWNPKNE